MDTNQLMQTLLPRAVDAAIVLFKTLAMWMVGRWLINVGIRLIANALTRQKVDNTIIGYVESTVRIVLNVILVVGLLSFFGIETTTFAGLLAGLGLAIGAAWGGMLSNFAAGALLVFLKPFRVRDFISAGGVTGTVDEIGMFVTAINTPDNVRTYVGNNKIFSDNIMNFNANQFRRVDITAPVSHAVDLHAFMDHLLPKIQAVPNVLASPAPALNILTYSEYGCILAIRPYCHNDHYWQVYFDTQDAIRTTFGSGSFPLPEVKTDLAPPTAQSA